MAFFTCSTDAQGKKAYMISEVVRIPTSLAQMVRVVSSGPDISTLAALPRALHAMDFWIPTCIHWRTLFADGGVMCKLLRLNERQQQARQTGPPGLHPANNSRHKEEMRARTRTCGAIPCRRISDLSIRLCAARAAATGGWRV